tara:strand:- start:14901 stop:15122 length:222 start_codon:yes stop_codon:yes gene_type:complete
MKRLQELTKEINDLTLKMELEYPELYEFMNENPMTIPCCEHPELNTKNFSDYLDSLKELLKHHIETHQNNQKP